MSLGSGSLPVKRSVPAASNEAASHPSPVMTEEEDTPGTLRSCSALAVASGRGRRVSTLSGRLAIWKRAAEAAAGVTGATAATATAAGASVFRAPAVSPALRSAGWRRKPRAAARKPPATVAPASAVPVGRRSLATREVPKVGRTAAVYTVVLSNLRAAAAGVGVKRTPEEKRRSTRAAAEREEVAAAAARARGARPRAPAIVVAEEDGAAALRGGEERRGTPGVVVVIGR